MLASKKTKRGVIGAVVLAGVLAVSGFAMTDVLVAPLLSHAGDGTGTIENETATAMHYVLNTTNADQIDAVQFTLSHALLAGGTAYIQPVTTGNAGNAASVKFWYSCVTSGTVSGLTASTTAPVCDTSKATYATNYLLAVDVDQTRVVAAD